MPTISNASELGTIEYATASSRRSLLYVKSLQEPDVQVETDGDHAFGLYGDLDIDTQTVVTQTNTQPQTELNGDWLNAVSGAPEFYEDVHVRPRIFDFGIVSTVERIEVSVFNGYRRTSKTWSAFTNNAGEGTDLIGEPTLPTVIGAYDEAAGTIYFEVLPAGDGVVDSDVIFDWSSGESIPVRVLITRVIPIATKRGGILVPEAGFVETLEFLTDILVRANGSEQRMSLRKSPRQTFSFRYNVDDDLVRAELDMLLAGNHDRIFAVPYWPGEVALTSAAAADDTTLSVGTTTYKDFRDTGSLLIFEDGGSYEVIGIDTLSANSITLAAPLGNAYTTQARVVPVRSGFLSESVSGLRYPVNLGEVSLAFETTDNEVDLADTSAFSSYNSKVLLDDYNSVRGTTRSGFAKRMFIIDSESGVATRRSRWSLSRQQEEKAFFAQGAQSIDNVRRLLYALRGQAVSFYLPTFRDELEVVDDLDNGTTDMTIAWCGFTESVGAQSPWDHVRITLNDGTTIEREITATEEPDETQTTEVLTVGTAWSSTVAKEDIARVEFLRLMRFDSDSITIDHERNGNAARIYAPVRGVLE